MPNPLQLLGAAVLAVLALGRPAAADLVDSGPGTNLFATLPTWGANFLDIDQDGDPDLNASHHFYTGNVFTNLGDGTFSFFDIPQIVVSLADRHAYTWVDLDGDGILDIVNSHGGGGGCGCAADGNELWQGTGNGNYVVVPGAGGMADTLGRGRAFSAADIDLDGDVDLYHAKATLAASPNSLYRNDGSLTFVDIAPALGLDETAGTQAGLFEDYDDDGDPDLLVGGSEDGRATVLWRNDGATFTDVTAAAFGSLPVISWADWGDYDNDEDMDLAIVEGRDGIWDAWHADSTEYWLFSHFRLGEDGVDSYTFQTPGEDPVARFRYNAKVFNDFVFLGPNGDHPSPAASFVVLTDSLVGAPTFTPGVDFGIYCWRESAGGPWRIEVSGAPGTFGNFSTVIETVNPVQSPADSSLEKVTLAPASARVFRNDGGVFAEQTGPLGFTTVTNPRGVSWVDFDNDGDLDLHQTNFGTTDFVGEPSILWRNDGATFAALTGAAWAPGSPDHFTDGGVWADYDRDGDQDLYLCDGAGPLFFSAAPPSVLFRNDGSNGNSLEITLNASTAGATPIGAKATCWVQGVPVHRRVRADSWEGFQRPLSLHFGLGGAASFDSLVVVWPDGERRFIPGGQDPTAAWIVGPETSKGFVGRVAPQPALGRQSLALDVPAPGRLRVTVHDVTGRRLRVIRDGAVARPGPWTLTWDGRDESGRRVPPGVYFLRGTGDLDFARKAVRLR